jgi:site-specific recombinase XerD
MKGLCKKAEVTVFNYHNLRHFGASFMASNSVPVTDIQTVLGHTEISTTSGYLQSLRQSLKESTESLQGIK